MSSGETNELVGRNRLSFIMVAKLLLWLDGGGGGSTRHETMGSDDEEMEEPASESAEEERERLACGEGWECGSVENARSVTRGPAAAEMRCCMRGGASVEVGVGIMLRAKISPEQGRTEPATHPFLKIKCRKYPTLHPLPK